MAELAYLAVVVGFFALAVLFVRACDLLLRRDAELAEDRDG